MAIPWRAELTPKCGDMHEFPIFSFYIVSIEREGTLDLVFPDKKVSLKDFYYFVV